MSTILITTPQNIELEFEFASVGDRIVASIVDSLVLFAYLIIAYLFVLMLGIGKMGNPIAYAAMGFILMVPVLFYSLLSETLMNGQTVGKRVMKIKVISLTGNQPSFSQYLLRWLFKILDNFFAGLVSIILIAVTERNQRLGDLVANTIVIKTTPRTALTQTLYSPVADTNYQVTYPEVEHLQDADMQLVKEVLLNIKKSGNTMLALNTMRRIEEVLGIKSQHEPVTFLYAILSDYNHISVRNI